MSKLNAFLAQNVKKVENTFFPASKRITDENGKPVDWEICCITAKENKDIRKTCFHSVPAPGGKKGQFTQEFDAGAYTAKIAARCTVFPNLNDTELQNSWGVMGAEALLTAMLTPGEFESYAEKVLEVNGFDDEGDLVENAKN